VKLINTLTSSKLFKEYQGNKRLQWMIVIIVGILCLSVVKQLMDGLSPVRLETKAQLDLLARLNNVRHLPMDTALLTSSQQQLTNTKQTITTVSSLSTAEAQGLQDIEQRIGGLITRKRLNLIGSEEIKLGGRKFWSVRIEVAGQLAEDQFISLLRFFDANQHDTRLSSLQYSATRSKSISLVTDLLYASNDND
jgi:hypothetical protein